MSVNEWLLQSVGLSSLVKQELMVSEIPVIDHAFTQPWDRDQATVVLDRRSTAAYPQTSSVPDC
jgi:hypothetical protein